MITLQSSKMFSLSAAINYIGSCFVYTQSIIHSNCIVVCPIARNKHTMLFATSCFNIINGNNRGPRQDGM